MGFARHLHESRGKLLDNAAEVTRPLAKVSVGLLDSGRYLIAKLPPKIGECFFECAVDFLEILLALGLGGSKLLNNTFHVTHDLFSEACLAFGVVNKCR